MLKFVAEIKASKHNTELLRQKTMTVDAELKAVSMSLTEFEAIQKGSKRQDVIRKEIQRIKRLQAQRKVEIDFLQVCAFRECSRAL